MLRRGALLTGVGRACEDVVAFRWLAGQQVPDFRSIGRFRQRHLAALGNVVLRAQELCRAAAWSLWVGRDEGAGQRLPQRDELREAVGEAEDRCRRGQRSPGPGRGRGRGQPVRDKRGTSCWRLWWTGNRGLRHWPLPASPMEDEAVRKARTEAATGPDDRTHHPARGTDALPMDQMPGIVQQPSSNRSRKSRLPVGPSSSSRPGGSNTGCPYVFSQLLLRPR
ncbi:transposase [Pseudarthrobacter sp. O4]|uniref:transposase n=1 Tax=Pseudarthrobacter sp. O4 TaxID=3418417 RepID=UPI003CFAB643